MSADKVPESDHLAALLGADPNPVLRVEAEGRIIFANESARRLFPGEGVPAPWNAAIREASLTGSGQGFDVEAGERNYTFVALPGREGEVYLYGREITARRAAERALVHRVEFERLVAVIASDLLLLNRERHDEIIARLLRSIGEFTGADRAYAFRVQGEAARATSEWVAPGMTPLPAPMVLRIADFRWLWSRLSSGELRVADVERLPPEAAPEKRIIDDLGIRSAVAVPLWWHDTLQGFIGFGNVREKRGWSEDDFQLLKLVAQLLSTALRRMEDEEQLISAKERLDEAQQIARVGSWKLAVGGREAEWSAEMYRIYGLDPGSFAPTFENWLALVHPEDRERMRSEFQTLIPGLPRQATYRIVRRKDGSQRFIRAVVTVHLDSRGRPAYVLGIDQDVTELTETERALASSNRALRTVSECDSVLVKAGDVDGLLREICRILVGIGGYDRVWVLFSEENGGRRLVPMAAGGGELSEAPAWDESSLPARAVAGRNPLFGSAEEATGGELDYLRSHGIHTVAALPLIGHGEVFGTLVIYCEQRLPFEAGERNILRELADDLAYGIDALRSREERDRAIKSLQASETNLRTMIEREADGVVVLDREWLILFANPAALKMLGRSMEDLVGEPFGLPILGGERTEIEVIRPDGSVAVAEMRAVETEWFKAPATVVSIHDITERKQLEQERERSAAQRQRALSQAIEAIAMAVEKRDPFTSGHQVRVARLAVAIAEELGVPRERIEGLRLAGMILGVGKIYVPAEILNRPGRLSQPEYDVIKSYPQIGYEIIKGIDFPWPVAEMLLQQHEHLDGSGYPRGLVDGQIIPEARILKVADVVDAMSSHRPYRPAAGLDAALQEIISKRGTWYEPEVVDACVRLFREKRFSF